MMKYRIIRWFAYTLELLTVFILQETPGLFPEVCGARPVAVIPAVLAIAMFETEIPSMVFGLVGGLLIDFGLGGLLGFHALILAAVCYFVSVMASDLFQTNFLTSLIVITLVTFAVMALQWACFYVLYGYRNILYALTAHYLPIAAYTVVLTPVAYYFNRAIATQIRSREE